MATATQIRLTEEEFLAADWSGYELVDGEPVDIPRGGRDAWLAGALFYRIAQFFDRHAVGLIFPQGTEFKAWPQRPNHLRKPDTMVFVNGRFPGDEPPDGTIDIAPDLAAEVVSPNDNAQALEEKVQEYLDAKVRLVWVIYPEIRTAHVFRRGEAAARIGPTGSLDGEDVLPGFRLPLADLFPAKAPGR
ncbi:MAG: Uma2 family endonuclease [Dehalococcoidia bacterium]